MHISTLFQLQIGIYYNSLCADTSRFITDQFLPAYELLGDLIDVFFIPFGKSFVSKTLSDKILKDITYLQYQSFIYT